MCVFILTGNCDKQAKRFIAENVKHLFIVYSLSNNFKQTNLKRDLTLFLSKRKHMKSDV